MSTTSPGCRKEIGQKGDPPPIVEIASASDRDLRFQPPAVENFSQDKEKDLPRRDRRDAERYVTGEQRSQIFITFDALPERLGTSRGLKWRCFCFP